MILYGIILALGRTELVDYSNMLSIQAYVSLLLLIGAIASTHNQGT